MSKGEMLSVFCFCVLGVFSFVFCRFGSLLLLLGALSGTIFGSELLVLFVHGRLMLIGVVFACILALWE